MTEKPTPWENVLSNSNGWTDIIYGSLIQSHFMRNGHFRSAGPIRRYWHHADSLTTSWFSAKTRDHFFNKHIEKTIRKRWYSQICRTLTNRTNFSLILFLTNKTRCIFIVFIRIRIYNFVVDSLRSLQHACPKKRNTWVFVNFSVAILKSVLDYESNCIRGFPGYPYG